MKNSTSTIIGDTLGYERYFIDQNSGLPLVYKPNKTGTDLIGFCSNNEELINSDLLNYGAVLFRGFDITNIDDFDNFIKYRIKEAAHYVGGATPRKPLSGLASTSTIFPNDQEIHLHNELSYEELIPQNLIFCCLIAPTSGGQTPIADVNKVLSFIDPNIVEEFKRKNGWKLTRNFGQCFGPSVKDGFGTEDLEQIKLNCEERNIQLEIIEVKKLRTTQIRKAVHQHPTKAYCELWLNHVAFWHTASIPKEYFKYMSDCLSVDEFPYFISFGDGTIIPDHYVEEIKQAYKKSEVIFNWQSGDILLLDNYQVAHGRKSYIGERLIAVAMG